VIFSILALYILKLRSFRKRSNIAKALLTPRRWLVMVADSGVVRRCFRRLNLYLRITRSSFAPLRTQHACSSTSATAGSSGATARLRPDNTAGGPKTSVSITPRNSKGYGEGEQASSSNVGNTPNTHLTGEESDAEGVKTADGLDGVRNTAPIIFRAFQPYKEGEETPLKKLPGTPHISEITGKALEALYARRNKTKLQNSESPVPKISAIEHLRHVEDVASDQSGDFDLSGTQEEKDDRSEPTIEERASPHSAKEEGDEWPRAARKRSTRDTLFEHLRNPKGTQTESIKGLSAKPPTENSKLEEDSAREKSEQHFHQIIRKVSVEDIEQKLQTTAYHSPNVNGVTFMLEELIQRRHVQPQARHYDALILSHCEHRHGSAAALYPILEEMEREKIGIGASTLSAVLKVLSIHPDAVLLSSIMQTISSQWMDPSASDVTYLIVSLVRLSQFELALRHLEHLISTSPPPDNFLHSPIPKYLYTTLLYRLASPAISDHTAILHFLYTLSDHHLLVPSTCIAYILDSASSSLHLDLTLYLWRSHIDTNYIIPNTGLCRNALLTAARASSSELATKAGKALESRAGSKGLEIEEIEMVHEAFRGRMDVLKGRGVMWGLQAVNRLEARMVQLRKKERWKAMAEGRWKNVEDEQAGMAREEEEGRVWREVDEQHARLEKEMKEGRRKRLLEELGSRIDGELDEQRARLEEEIREGERRIAEVEERKSSTEGEVEEQPLKLEDEVQEEEKGRE
jgi:hypothetical protein